MSVPIQNNNPLSYTGVKATNPPQIVKTTRNPTANNNQFDIGTIWINTATATIFELSQIVGGAATWTELGANGGSIQVIAPDNGILVVPFGGGVNFDSTAGQITVTGTANTVTWSLPAAVTAPGSVTATSTLTATLGNITATNGNLVLGTAGNKIVSTSVATTTAAGANSFGTVTLVSGSATISTTAVTANSIIMLTRQSPGATGANPLGMLSVGTIVAGTSFIINALTTANSTTNVATDVSVIGWMIIN